MVSFVTRQVNKTPPHIHPCSISTNHPRWVAGARPVRQSRTYIHTYICWSNTEHPRPPICPANCAARASLPAVVTHVDNEGGQRSRWRSSLGRKSHDPGRLAAGGSGGGAAWGGVGETRVLPWPVPTGATWQTIPEATFAPRGQPLHLRWVFEYVKLGG